MLREIKNYVSPLTKSIDKLRIYLSNRPLITDLLAKLVITFGVVLIVGGLYLMLADSSASTVKDITSTVEWVPGIPFYIGGLGNLSVATVGLVTWLLGVDLLLVGLGLWVRHTLARLAALAVFALAACFQFIQFLNVGILGLPASLAELLIEGTFVIFLFLRFDSSIKQVKPLNNQT